MTGIEASQLANQAFGYGLIAPLLTNAANYKKEDGSPKISGKEGALLGAVMGGLTGGFQDAKTEQAMSKLKKLSDKGTSSFSLSTLQQAVKKLNKKDLYTGGEEAIINNYMKEHKDNLKDISSEIGWKGRGRVLEGTAAGALAGALTGYISSKGGEYLSDLIQGQKAKK